MNLNKIFARPMIFSLCILLYACEDFVEVDPPAHKLVNQQVFNNDEMAESALQGIYNELFRIGNFSNGGASSVTALAGLSAHQITAYDQSDLEYLEFEENEILPNNPPNLSLWNSAYKIIYQVNALLEGMESSTQITASLQERIEGEAMFIRAFTYFYLVNLYGEVPLALTTDYRKNARLARKPVADIYDQVLLDLQLAVEVLPEEYRDGERIYVNKYVAMAFLARVHLYLENWEQAEYYSNQVINQSGMYSLLSDVDAVFLKNSTEAIWQISPAGRGSATSNTNEGYLFISSFPVFTLTDDVPENFTPNDLRYVHWIGYNEEREAYYPFKYKDANSSNNITEYSMVLRLAEQYFIRAEARAKSQSISGAITDINHIRSRAGIDLISNNSNSTEEGLMELLMEERQRELFTEWGHRWFDLIRFNKASAILGANNANWESTDVRFPIPEQERIKNPNLGQNLGY